jgi:AraC-like DNA-binding protein
VLQRSSKDKERCVKRTGAARKHKATRRWSQKLQIETRWSDTTQRIQLLRQAAEFIDNNQGKGIVAADIHQHLGLHARKVNEIFLRFYGVSASTYLREYKCKVLFVQILMAPKNLQQDHYPAAGMTGSPGEKRAFKSLYGVSVDDHWSRSQAESSRDHAREAPHPSLPNALLWAEETIQKLMATITGPTAN